MFSVGKIINCAGRVIGTVFEYDIKVTGEIIGAVADLSNKKELANISRSASKTLGEAVGGATMVLSELTGDLVDVTIKKSSEGIKYVGKNVVKVKVTQEGDMGIYDEEKYVKAKFKIIDHR